MEAIYFLLHCTQENIRMSFLFDAGNSSSSSLMGAAAVPGMAYRTSQQPQQLMQQTDTREESYMLLLELSTQEPMLQSCFKVIESTCLARGVHLKIRGKTVSAEFQKFLDRYYLPFAEKAIRHFFTLGFVPWRLRRLATGDFVPEAIPLGMFRWSIDSIPNRTARPRPSLQQRKKLGEEKEQVAAKRAFDNQKQHFASRQVPYPLQTDAKAEPKEAQEDADDDGQQNATKKRSITPNTPAYYRQQDALHRQLLQLSPTDDEDTKMLRYIQ